MFHAHGTYINDRQHHVWQRRSRISPVMAYAMLQAASELGLVSGTARDCSNMLINKGFCIVGQSHENCTAVYNHDGRWYIYTCDAEDYFEWLTSEANSHRDRMVANLVNAF